MDQKEFNEKTIEVLEKINEHLQTYVDKKDSLPILEVVGDASSLVGFLTKSISWIGKMKFKAFLKGLFYENPSPHEMDKLLKYIEKSEKRTEFITNELDKVLASNSKIACCIMGILTSKMINLNRDATYEDLLLIQALKELNDFEIKSFIKLCKTKTLNKNLNLNPVGVKRLTMYKEKYEITNYELSLLKSNWRKSGIVELGFLDSDMGEREFDYNQEEDDESIETYITRIGLLLFEYGEQLVSHLDGNNEKESEVIN